MFPRGSLLNLDAPHEVQKKHLLQIQQCCGNVFSHCFNSRCKWNEFCPEQQRLAFKYCISFRRVCDNFWDCPQGADERVCPTNCLHKLICKGASSCLHPSEVCDGIVHCSLNPDDEDLCLVRDCPYLCHCKGHAMQCISRRLKTVPLEAFYMKLIVFAGNRLSQLGTQDITLKYLLILDISHNQIKKIHLTDFDNLPYIQRLDIYFKVLT